MAFDPDENGTSLIMREPDMFDLMKLQDISAVEALLRQPAIQIVEVVTGALRQGRLGILAVSGRLAQGALKLKLLQQFAEEYQSLRAAGKLRDDWGESKFGFKTWTELVAIIDSDDPPDFDRLEALKAMFYAVNKVNQEDNDCVFAYQLWQITKRLQSGPLLLLKTLCEKSTLLDGVPSNQWPEQAAKLSGLKSNEIILLYGSSLAEQRLATSVNMPGDKFFATNLGRQLVVNIQTYTTDLGNAKQKKVS